LSSDNEQGPDLLSIHQELLNQDAMPGPLFCNFVSQVVDHWASDHTRVSLVSVDLDTGDEEEVTYASMVEKSNRLANHFVKKGLTQGQSAALMLGQHPVWWYSLVALMRIGVGSVPCPRLLTEEDLAYRINDIGISAIVTSPEQQRKIDNISAICPSLTNRVTIGQHSQRWDSFSQILRTESSEAPSIFTTTADPCLYLYTSGTTGQPKAVQHNFDYPFFHWPTGKRWLKATPEDLVYNASDTGWGFSVWTTLAAWSMGSQILVTPSNKKFDPQKILTLLREKSVSIFCAAPTVLRLLVAEPNFNDFVFPRLKRIVTVGEALDEVVIQKFESMGVEVAVGFGQAETPLIMGRVDNDTHVPGAMGGPISPYQVVLLDDDNQPLPPGNEGQIAVDIQAMGSRAGIMRGYANAPERTAQAFTADGHYFKTGDWAYYESDGVFRYRGRHDDLIKSRGYRIGPDEVEKAGMSHPAVAKIAVVGVPTDRVSKAITVKGYILLKPGIAPSKELKESIQAHIKCVTAPHKYPRKIEFLDLDEWGQYETTSGKIRRVGLRERDSIFANKSGEPTVFPHEPTLR
jgi:acyl-coenzyme A synthetase/AMP-(fatty) acid ligase